MNKKSFADLIKDAPKSDWREKAEFRIKNREWLRVSQQFALRVLEVLKEKQMSQKELADIMGVSPQRISEVLKGTEKLNIETIVKFQTALNVPLFEITKKEKKEIVTKVVIYKAVPFFPSEVHIPTGNKRNLVWQPQRTYQHQHCDC